MSLVHFDLFKNYLHVKKCLIFLKLIKTLSHNKLLNIIRYLMSNIKTIRQGQNEIEIDLY